MKKVLIITHTKDNDCINQVSKHIRSLGGEVIRFNVDLYPLHSSLATEYTNGEWKIYLHAEGQIHTLHDADAVWYRRSFNLGDGLREVLEGEYLSSVHGEIRQVLFGMLEGLHCFQIGRVSQYRRLDSKEEQLKIASALGLLVPDTCITNDPDRARAFVAAHPAGVITKMQSSFAIYREGSEHVVFTNVITEENMQQIDSLQYCPMQFQQKIEKAVELRVTIVGEAVFCFAVDSQKTDNAEVDWRRKGVELLDKWVPYELPADIQDKLLRLMDVYEANYGAIDILVTPSGEYYFLEINAAGEFFWLDYLIGNAISEQIAKVLLGLAPRRYTPMRIPAIKELV
jgi:hypothetical protein